MNGESKPKTNFPAHDRNILCIEFSSGCILTEIALEMLAIVSAISPTDHKKF